MFRRLVKGFAGFDANVPVTGVVGVVPIGVRLGSPGRVFGAPVVERVVTPVVCGIFLDSVFVSVGVGLFNFCALVIGPCFWRVVA